MSFFAEGSSMHRWCLAAACAAAISCVAVPAAAAKQRPQDRLDAYTVVTTADQLADIRGEGPRRRRQRASGPGRAGRR